MEEVLSKLDAVLDCRKDGRFDKIAEFVDTTPKLKQSPYRGLVLAHLRARLERIGANDALSNFFCGDGNRCLGDIGRLDFDN